MNNSMKTDDSEVTNSSELAKRLNVPESWVRSRSNPKRTSDPIPHYNLGRYITFPWGSDILRKWLERQLVSTNRGQVKNGNRMTQSVRYQMGQLYREHGAWFVRYRERLRQEDSSVKLQRRSKRLGSVVRFPEKSDVEPVRVAFMQKINSDLAISEGCLTLIEFVDAVYLPWVQTERRASTYKGYREAWENHMPDRIGQIRVREFRTVHVSRMLRSIAAECDLTRTTLQRIKSVLSGIFARAINEGAFDGANPVQGALIPNSAREAGETYAYPLDQILRILATAS